MRWVLTGLFWLVLIVVVGGLSVGGWMAWRFSGSAPKIEGEIAIRGLDSEIQILRDEYGVPHIFGATEADVFYGLGYAHAQDRLFQMELIRRSIEGRLAEVAGSSALRLDARARIQGRHLTAQAITENIDGPTRDAVEAYTRGVNAFIQHPVPSLPPEYAFLMFKPEPWDPADTAAVLLYMADVLADGLDEDINDILLSKTLTPAQMRQFLSPYPADAPTILSDADLGLAPAPDAVDEETDGDAEDEPLERVTEDIVPGSNNWVVDGERTFSAAPLLANDPHLDAGAPGYWYLARLALPDGDVVGATLPGAPFIVIGHNEHIAWGVTNGQVDVVDLKVRPREEIDARYRDERIKVRFGREAAVSVETTEEGPVLDPRYFNVDDLVPEGSAAILQTVVDDPDNTTAIAVYQIMKARTWKQFRDAGKFWVAPVQNVIYADIDGHIGYQAPGRVPIRDAAGDWVGEIPFEDTPHVRNPDKGYVATANNKIAPDAYPYELSRHWGAAFRAMRIEERLTATRIHDVASFRNMQMDVTSSYAREMVPWLLEARPVTDQGLLAQAVLAHWNYSFGSDEAGPVVFQAVLEGLERLVADDELGPEIAPYYAGPRRMFLRGVVTGEYAVWCDDVTTAEREETCPQLIADALDVAGQTIAEVYGPDPTTWNWGDAAPVVFAHPIFGEAPILKRWFSRQTRTKGDFTTINRAGVASVGPAQWRTRHVSTFRGIYDLADLDGSQFMHTPGQSGHPLSPHAYDLIAPWSAGDYIEIRTDWDIEAPPPGMRLLTLKPGQ